MTIAPPLAWALNPIVTSSWPPLPLRSYRLGVCQAHQEQPQQARRHVLALRTTHASAAVEMGRKLIRRTEAR